MKKCLFIIALCTFAFSCTEDFPENQSAQDSTTPLLNSISLTENGAKQKFAEILSKAIYENIDLRSFIKDKAIQQFDNDFDVFYPILKNEEVGNSKTFRNILLRYTTEEELSNIERALPLLNIYIPDLSLFTNITPYNWDITDNQIPVTFKENQTSKMLLYFNGEKSGEIPQNCIPGFHLLVVKNNERVIPVSINTRGVANSYQFIDKAFDGINSKQNTPSTRSMSEPDNIDWLSEDIVDPIVKDAYEKMKENPSLQRDNIYYGLTNNKQEGSLNMNIDEYIYRIQISPSSYFTMTDQEGDPTRKDKGTISNKKGEISDDEALSRFWIDGNFEIILQVFTGVKNIKELTAHEYVFNVKPQELFNVPIEKSYRHKTMFRHSKFYYTIDPHKLERKWYYPRTKGHDTRLPKWDISTQSLERFINIFERDADEKITYSQNKTTTFAANFRSSADGDIPIGTKGGSIKIGLGYDTTKSTSTSSTITIETTKESDQLGTLTLNFYDAIIVEKNSSKGYRPKNVSNGTVSITISPMSDAFSRSVSF